MAAGNPIDIQDGIDTSGFYFQLGVAQVLIKLLLVNYMLQKNIIEKIRVDNAVEGSKEYSVEV